MAELRIFNPKIGYMLLNVILLSFAFFIVVWCLPFTTHYPLQKYWEAYFLIYIPIDFIIGIMFHKYHSYRHRKMKSVLWSILQSELLSFIISGTMVMMMPTLRFSIYVLFAFVVVMLVLEFIVAVVYFSLRNSVNIELKYNISAIKHDPQLPLILSYMLDNKTVERIENLVRNNSSDNALRNIKKYVSLNYSDTIVVSTSTIFNIQNLKDHRFSAIVNLTRVNNIRSINEFFVAIHDKLPYQGTFIGCFQSKSQYKKNFLEAYPPVINYIFYAIVCVVKRFFPKWSFTRELYFWITGGRRRILSKAEVYGRLYACGFVITGEYKANKLNYFVVQKKNRPIRHEILNYSSMIKLHRVGKNGKLFDVYKFRTMHPYSEFLQPYIYEKNSLQEGGKFRHDIRVTSLGNFMRKYWLDELPMLFNLLRGDMKLVGVRPLSNHYFSLYSKELQEKRTRHKPGLLPPFYADMPKTLDEIQASEMKYLTECEKKGTFITDVKYIFKILNNILLKKARSH